MPPNNLEPTRQGADGHLFYDAVPLSAGSKYHLLRALRPFSFAVALLACGTGCLLAWLWAEATAFNIVLAMAGGVLLQAGVNLINDHADLQDIPHLNSGEKRAIRRNFRLGLVFFALAALVGFWFVYQVGSGFFWLCLVGLAGALGYTLKPVNYKARGLGVVLVFWLMGVLMVSGCYLAVAGHYHWQVLPVSLPISLLVALLLLSNEIRDFEADKTAGIATLTVKKGQLFSCWLFKMLGLATALTLLGLALWYQSFWLLLPQLALVAIVRLLPLLKAPAAARRSLPPNVGRILLVFGVLYNLALYLSFHNTALF